MAIFRPFRAFRPSVQNQALIPSLPYDVLTAKEAAELARGNEMSFLHVDKAEIDLPQGTDAYSDSVYEKARENLLFLENTGALQQDEKPCFYIYRQIMRSRCQIGLVGCASVDDYIDNTIKKHEKTLKKKEEDRLRHVDVTNANTGPIFLTYRKDSAINFTVSVWMNENEPVYDFTYDGVQQTVWVIDNDEVINRLSSLFSGVSSLYIADGHHRCASAVHVAQRRREAAGSFTGQEEFNYFLAVAFPDDDLEIMDYNRVVADLNGLDERQFIEKISEKFIVTPENMPCHPIERHMFGMYLRGQWYMLKARRGTVDEGDPVKRLDVSVLQDNLLGPVLGIDDPKNNDRIDFVGGIRGLAELERRVNKDMAVAFAMHPTTIAELMDIADAGEIMPPKSTWFEPKLLSGIFIHNLT
ncbi:MAG: DUF1015 family protein [Clostridiales bacterium]|nr:DUF1015 family protein [Clostridiales bacterium]